MAYRFNLSLFMFSHLIQRSTQLRRGFTKPQIIAIIIFGGLVFLSAFIPHFAAFVVAIILAAAAYEAITEATPVSTSLPEVDNDAALLHNFLYMKSKYLKSAEWQAKRKLVIARDRYHCTSCGTLRDLRVHHKSHYISIPNEPLSALITLCDSCHTELHERIGYPKSYNDYVNWSH